MILQFEQKRQDSNLPAEKKALEQNFLSVPRNLGVLGDLRADFRVEPSVPDGYGHQIYFQQFWILMLGVRGHRSIIELLKGVRRKD